MKWGLLPAWADREKVMTKPINAKAEGVASTAFFRSAFKSRRCIVPATGFYEWEKTEPKNIPHLFTDLSSDRKMYALMRCGSQDSGFML
jgi:putative SOS response-associated peptidase YedK